MTELNHQSQTYGFTDPTAQLHAMQADLSLWLSNEIKAGRGDAAIGEMNRFFYKDPALDKTWDQYYAEHFSSVDLDEIRAIAFNLADTAAQMLAADTSVGDRGVISDLRAHANEQFQRSLEAENNPAPNKTDFTLPSLPEGVVLCPEDALGGAPNFAQCDGLAKSTKEL